MVGFLGMALAGGAMGARNASNMNVQAMNQLEMEHNRNSMEMDRDAIRQKYLEKGLQVQNEGRLQQMKAKGILDEAKYGRERQDKIVDSEMSHKRKMELTGMVESGKDKRSNASIAAANARAEKRNKLSVAGVDGDGFNPRSPEGKAAADLVSSGRARNLEEAYDDVHRMKLLGGLAGNQFMTSPKDLFDFYDKYKRERGSSMNPGVAQQPQNDLIRNFNPKTGAFE